MRDFEKKTLEEAAKEAKKWENDECNFPDCQCHDDFLCDYWWLRIEQAERHPSR